MPDNEPSELMIANEDEIMAHLKDAERLSERWPPNGRRRKGNLFRLQRFQEALGCTSYQIKQKIQLAN